MALSNNHSIYSQFGVEGETSLYELHIRPIVYAVSLMLPVAYIIGLVFTLKTHTSHLTEEFTEEQLQRDNSFHQGNIYFGNSEVSKRFW